MLHQSPFRRGAFRAALLVPLLALLAGCDRAVLDPAGDIARQQRDIIYTSTALMLLIIVPVMILVVVFAWRYRKGGGGTYDPSFDHSTALELAIWSAPLLIIIALGALTWSSTHLLDPFRAIPAKPGTRPVVVQVVSLDWKWLFIYPEEGIATVNELALPVNRPVRFEITSSNMMNTFYAPTLAGMIYAMPGMQSQLHAVLRRPGDFEGYSGSYSGAGFSDMRFRLKGLDEAGYARWLAAARASGGVLGTADYRRLAAPSEKVPVLRFGRVDPGLFRRIVERCVDPGTRCMSEMMHREGAHDGTMPPRAPSVPPAKPEGAIFKQGGEKGTGKNITKPVKPGDAPGAASPGAPANRGLS